MDEGLAALQEALEALNEAIQLIDDPALVNALTTCLSQMAAVQQKLMQGAGGQPQAQGQGGPPMEMGPPPGADPRQALLQQLVG